MSHLYLVHASDGSRRANPVSAAVDRVQNALQRSELSRPLPGQCAQDVAKVLARFTGDAAGIARFAPSLKEAWPAECILDFSKDPQLSREVASLAEACGDRHVELALKDPKRFKKAQNAVFDAHWVLVGCLGAERAQPILDRWESHLRRAGASVRATLQSNANADAAALASRFTANFDTCASSLEALHATLKDNLQAHGATPQEAQVGANAAVADALLLKVPPPMRAALEAAMHRKSKS